VPKPQKKPKQLGLKLDSGSFTISGARVLLTQKLRQLTAAFVERRREQFEAGEEWALIDAVDLCARMGMAMPVWLATAFCERYMSWSVYKVKTLDKAFGVERKGFRVKDRARRERLRPRIVWLILELHADGQGMPMDERIFAKVAKELKKDGIKVGGSTVRDIYYEPETESCLRSAGVLLKTSK
jgi:hypothetical protein